MSEKQQQPNKKINKRATATTSTLRPWNWTAAPQPRCSPDLPVLTAFPRVCHRKTFHLTILPTTSVSPQSYSVQDLAVRDGDGDRDRDDYGGGDGDGNGVRDGDGDRDDYGGGDGDGDGVRDGDRVKLNPSRRHFSSESRTVSLPQQPCCRVQIWF